MQILASRPHPARTVTAATVTTDSMNVTPSITSGSYDHHRRVRSSHHHSWCWSGFRKGDILGTRTRRSFCTRVSASAPSPLSSNQAIKDSPCSKIYQEVLESAREKFTQEISFQSKDKDISLAKVLLYIAAEDEAFMALNREMDIQSLSKERISVSVPSDSPEWESVEKMQLGGRNIEQWISELDTIAKEVEVELISRDIGCHLVEVLDAVNQVLFGVRGYKRNPVLIDSKCSYLHSVLSSGCGSAILISIIYVEVCRRLGVAIVGSRVGEDFLIWPQNANPEELFKVPSADQHSLFATVNGNCVDDPKSMASDLTSDSLSSLEIASNRDIIGIALANMIRLYWKRSSRMTRGLLLTSPLRKIVDSDTSNAPLLRPKDLRLAIMASERLLILQPHNWSLRRDHGMMLYFNRRYGEAVQELSICLAFAPEEESSILEAFVERLHLLRLESSWKSLGFVDHLAT